LAQAHIGTSRDVSTVRCEDGSGAQFLDALASRRRNIPESGKMSADRVDEAQVAVGPNPTFKSRVECSAVLTVGKQCQRSSRKCRQAPCRRSGSRRSRPCKLRWVLSQTFRAADWRQLWMRERPNHQFWNLWKRETGRQPMSGSSDQIDREGQSTPSPRRWPQSCLSATRTSSEMLIIHYVKAIISRSPSEQSEKDHRK
jgi:hypothetical protein